MEKQCRSVFKFSKKIEAFLATGNLPATSKGLGLMQTTGFVILAENINRKINCHCVNINKTNFILERSLSFKTF